MSFAKKTATYSAAVLLMLGVAGGATPSYANETPTEADATISQDSAPEVNKLRAEITKQANTGDSTAAADLKKIDALSPDQVEELEGYLNGTKQVPAKNTGNVTIDRSQGTTENTTAFRSASTVKEIWGTEAFTFAGVKISETKVTGKYTVSNGSVTGTVGQTCTVERSYNPMQTVTSSHSSAHIANGKAIFECHVTSNYGLPVIGGNYSERDGIQFLEGNASGEVVGNGWR